MKTFEQLCTETQLRLVDGERPGDDPTLAAHVRGCLRCFRTASELRQVPQIAELLRNLDQPDPGELFWASFPKTVADAWERQRQPAVTAGAGWWQRLGRWIQLPVPAALSGAAVAAALVLAVVHRAPVSVVSAPAPAAPVAAVETGAAESPLEEEAIALLGDDDPLEALELADATVVTRLGLEPPTSDEGGELEPSPAEELELLETDDLSAVAQALRGRSRI
jgi:hypothetical protein